MLRACKMWNRLVQRNEGSFALNGETQQIGVGYLAESLQMSSEESDGFEQSQLDRPESVPVKMS